MRILTPSKQSADNQLREEIAARCRRQLKKLSDARKRASDTTEWETLRGPLLDTIRAVFPDFMYDRAPIASRVISRHDFGDYRVENVIFESYPGWEVNGTVYLPANPGRYPGVVCPTGHSCKTRESYQIAGQTFARNGYIAISFDPPGCVGEIAHLNEHFTNGLIGYLTGIWSNTHFVLDAIRCIDYLETRDDVDMACGGVAMTGVSGGGATTLYAALIDERVLFQAPVCCLNEHELLHLTDWYTSCPEQFGPGLIASGIDFTDLVALYAPKPCLIVGGRGDPLFDYHNMRRLYHDAEDVYRLYGREQEIGVYIDESIHAYTLNMATEVVRWMNRIFKPGVDPLPLCDADLKLQAPELLHCHPSNAVNMFTINKEAGRRLHGARQVPTGVAGQAYVRERLRDVLGLEASDFPDESVDWTWRARVEEQRKTLDYRFRSVDLQSAGGHVPGLLLQPDKRSTSAREPWRPAARSGPLPAVLMIDEAGKWEGFRSNGPLAALGETFVYNVDVSGFGELAPAPVWYDISWFGDIDRILTYLSVASGKSVMGMRVRDALLAWHYLRSLPEVDTDRLVLAGKGLGAVVALLASAFIAPLRKLVLWEPLFNYQALTEEFPFAWQQSVIVPNILQHLDLQDVLAHAPCEGVTVINPLDASRVPVDGALATAIYPASVQVHTGLNSAQSREAFVRAVAGD